MNLLKLIVLSRNNATPRVGGKAANCLQKSVFPVICYVNAADAGKTHVLGVYLPLHCLCEPECVYCWLIFVWLLRFSHTGTFFVRRACRRSLSCAS